MDYGWVKLHRKLISNPVYQNSAYLHVWIHLLLKATHKSDKIMWNGGTLEIKEGQCIVGRKKIALETRISESSVERALSWLENEGQIKQQTNNKFRVITILHWEEYQDTEHQTDSKRTASGQPADTFKNVKNDKKVKKDPAPSAEDDAAKFIFLFKPLNPTLGRIYGRPPQREAAGRLLKLHPLDWWEKFMGGYILKFPERFCPKATTPIQLEDKLAKIYGYAEGLRREEIKSKNNVLI